VLSLLFKPYPAHPAQQCNDERLNTVTAFTSRNFELIPQLDLQETKTTLEGLCCELNDQDFPSNEQQRLSNVLVRVPPALPLHSCGQRMKSQQVYYALDYSSLERR
jgi:hypothetical protein